MPIQALHARALKVLRHWAESRWYALAVGGIACVASLSIFVPFGGLLAAAVLLAPKRWRSTALGASVGTAAGATLVFLALVHLGYKPLVAAYPELMQTPIWIDTKAWLGRYGVFALVLIAALPVPLMPALILASVGDLPAVEVGAAVWLGRLTKFYVYAWATHRCADWWTHRRTRQGNGGTKP